jgi:hypothetical protein
VNSISAYLILPLFIAAFGLAGAELFTSFKISSLERIERLIPTESTITEASIKKSVDTGRNVYQAQLAYEESLNLPLVSRDMGYATAQLLYRIGLLERSEDRRLEYFCRALANLSAALQRQPFDSKLLVSWANLRQLLSGIDCSEPLTKGDFEQVARYALTHDGTNAEVLFSSAQILLWAGKKEEAYKLLKSFLEFGLFVNERQYNFIERQLNRDLDISAIIPGHFPQIVEWSSRIRLKNQALFDQGKSVLTELQLEALLRNEAELKAGKIPTQLYFDRLTSLLEVASSSQVRKRIDVELSRYYGLQGQDKLQRYLDSRRAYDSIQVNGAVITADTRPIKAPFINWLTLEPITLNHFYNSVGFYVPQGSAVKYIELVGAKDSSLISEVSLKLFVSEGNQQWSDITQEALISSFEMAGLPRVVFTVPDQTKRYWKINFSSASRDGRFTNRLSEMVQVYGREAR